MQPSLYTCYHQPLNLKFSIHLKTSVFLDLMKGYESIIVVDYTNKSS